MFPGTILDFFFFFFCNSRKILPALRKKKDLDELRVSEPFHLACLQADATDVTRLNTPLSAFHRRAEESSVFVAVNWS